MIDIRRSGKGWWRGGYGIGQGSQTYGTRAQRGTREDIVGMRH
jgi:hypothetical protein